MAKFATENEMFGLLSRSAHACETRGATPKSCLFHRHIRAHRRSGRVCILFLSTWRFFLSFLLFTSVCACRSALAVTVSQWMWNGNGEKRVWHICSKVGSIFSFGMQSTTMTTQRWHKAYDIWPISISEMRALLEAGDDDNDGGNGGNGGGGGSVDDVEENKNLITSALCSVLP